MENSFIKVLFLIGFKTSGYFIRLHDAGIELLTNNYLLFLLLAEARVDVGGLRGGEEPRRRGGEEPLASVLVSYSVAVAEL